MSKVFKHKQKLFAVLSVRKCYDQLQLNNLSSAFYLLKAHKNKIFLPKINKIKQENSFLKDLEKNTKLKFDELLTKLDKIQNNKITQRKAYYQSSLSLCVTPKNEINESNMSQVTVKEEVELSKKIMMRQCNLKKLIQIQKMRKESIDYLNSFASPLQENHKQSHKQAFSHFDIAFNKDLKTLTQRKYQKGILQSEIQKSQKVIFQRSQESQENEHMDQVNPDNHEIKCQEIILSKKSQLGMILKLSESTKQSWQSLILGLLFGLLMCIFWSILIILHIQFF